MFPYGLLQGLDDPSSIGTFQRNCAHDLAREVINGHEDLNGPQSPTPDFRRVDGPHMIGIPGRDGAGFWLLLWLLRGRWGGGSASRSRPLKDVPHRRRREEDTQQFQLVGNSNPAPTEIRFGDLPDERGDLRWRLVRRRAGWLLIFDLVQPTVERGPGDTEIPGDLAPGDLEGLHVPEDEKPLTNRVSRVLALLVEVFLKDRDLHFELVDPVFEKEYFFGFGICVHGSQPL